MRTLAAAILPSWLMNSGRRSLKYYGGIAHHSEVGSGEEQVIKHFFSSMLEKHHLDMCISY